MGLDLTALPAFYLGKYSQEKISEVTGCLPSTVVVWLRKGNIPSIEALNALLAFDPQPLGTVTPLYTNPEPGTKLMILVPLSTPPAPKMLDSLIRLYDKREMTFERFSFNCLSVSRNVLAARFLASPATWGWWMDGDALLPAGDSAWFKEAAEVPQMPDAFAGIHSIYRALVHQKTIVSCSYIARRKGGPVQFGATPELVAKVKRGPRAELVEVPWAGFHGILTHRSVFEDIAKTQGDEIRMRAGGIGTRFGYSHGFFNPTDGESPGDDIPWCNRAAKAGHKVHVDLAIAAAHVGDRAYTWNDL
jgi:transcriptional regulator with XRE-family HTH domain